MKNHLKCLIVKLSVQFSSVAQSCLTLCDSMNCSMPGLPVHHQLPEFTQTHVHRVSDAIQPSHPLPSPSSPAPNPSQHQGLLPQVNSSHELAKVLEFQLPPQSFQGKNIGQPFLPDFPHRDHSPSASPGGAVDLLRTGRPRTHQMVP